MRFSEFDITEAAIPSNYEIAPNMRPQPGPPKPIPNFVAKSALDVKQDPADVARQEQPAFQRKANQQPPIPNTAGNARPGTYSPTNNNLGKLGRVSPGEPTMGQPIPNQAKPATTATPSVNNQTRPAAPAVSTVQPATNQARPATTTTPSVAPTNVSPTTQATNNVSAPSTTPTATTTPTAPAKGSMTSWQQGPNASAPAKAPSPAAYNVGYRAGAAYNAYQKTPPEQSRIQAGINAANAAIKAIPPAPPAAKIVGPTSQYIPPRTPDQAKAISNGIIKNLGRSAGSEANTYASGLGAQGSIFQNQQHVKDLEKELATKGSDPTQQAELLKYRAIVKSQEEQVKKDAKILRDRFPNQPGVNGQGQQEPPTSQSKPAPTQQAPAAQQKSVTAVTAPQNTATPTQQAPAAQQKSATPQQAPTAQQKSATPQQAPTPNPAQSTPPARALTPTPTAGYKGSAGSQTIQQLNPDRIQDVNKIYAGDTINLPGGGTYTIKQGDTLDQIARNQSAPVAPAASIETPATVLTPKSTDVEKLPTEKVKETSDDKSLNRIKSLAGLK